MWLFTQSLTATRNALIYITIGSLTVIWTIIWYVYLSNNPPKTDDVYYWCAGFLGTGVTLVLIGVGLGWIARAARQADLPAAGVPLVVVKPQPIAAAAAPLVKQ